MLECDWLDVLEAQMNQSGLLLEQMEEAPLGPESCKELWETISRSYGVTGGGVGGATRELCRII